MIQVTYKRNGIFYDHLQFRTLKGIKRWMRWFAIPEGVTEIRIIA